MYITRFFLPDINETRVFSTDLQNKITEMPIFLKIPPVVAELFMRKDTRTDRHDEANSRFFLQFCESD